MLTGCSVGGIPSCVCCVAITGQSLQQKNNMCRPQVPAESCMQCQLHLWLYDKKPFWVNVVVSHSQSWKTLSLQPRRGPENVKRYLPPSTSHHRLHGSHETFNLFRTFLRWVLWHVKNWHTSQRYVKWNPIAIPWELKQNLASQGH